MPEGDIAAYYELANVVLVTHPRHVGTSQSLAYAANAGKPVLASSFGLLGALVRRHALGVTVDAHNPAEIAQGMTRLIEGNLPGDFDPVRSAQFGQENSVEHFTQTLMTNILSPLPEHPMK